MSSKEQDSIYTPSEDTFMIIRAIRKYSFEKVLEIGIGSGLVLSELSKKNIMVIGVDINKEAIKIVKDSLPKASEKTIVHLVRCDSASPFKKNIFDLIVFNPPYLPSEQVDDFTINGGTTGVEISVRWFKEASICIRKGGKIVFSASSLSDVKSLLEYVNNLGFKYKISSRRYQFFEDLMIIEAKS
jgi:release factor glutamine methyltransferase